jgi:hypothetical protein
MKANRVEAEGVPGQDSFLDVVANLVGIMIILVMVVGTRARDAIVSGEESLEEPSAGAPVEAGETAPAAATPQPVDEGVRKELVAAEASAARAAGETRDIESEIEELDLTIRREQMEIERRRWERNQLHLVLTALERHFDEFTGELDEAKQADFAVQREIAKAKHEAEKLAEVKEGLASSAQQTSVLEHLPTPMAKTVFGKEIQFRLTGGKLAYIPWDDLLNRLKDEAPEKIWKLKDADSITETLGPVGDFRMKYILRRARYAVAMPGGDSVRERVELERFTITPVREDLGETVDQALQPGSNFNLMLAGADPRQTTITIWLYPDSFQHFRKIKHALYERGFLTASRPMPEGHPIGGSPDGSRSAAQ